MVTAPEPELRMTSSEAIGTVVLAGPADEVVDQVPLALQLPVIAYLVAI